MFPNGLSIKSAKLVRPLKDEEVAEPLISYIAICLADFCKKCNKLKFRESLLKVLKVRRRMLSLKMTRKFCEFNIITCHITCPISLELHKYLYYSCCLKVWEFNSNFHRLEVFVLRKKNGTCCRAVEAVDKFSPFDCTIVIIKFCALQVLIFCNQPKI